MYKYKYKSMYFTNTKKYICKEIQRNLYIYKTTKLFTYLTHKKKYECNTVFNI